MDTLPLYVLRKNECLCDCLCWEQKSLVVFKSNNQHVITYIRGTCHTKTQLSNCFLPNLTTIISLCLTYCMEYLILLLTIHLHSTLHVAIFTCSLHFLSHPNHTVKKEISNSKKNVFGRQVK